MKDQQIKTEQETNATAASSQPTYHKRDKRAVINNLRQFFIIFCAALATAVAVEVFLLPCDVVIGSALGVASILDILLCTAGTKWYFSAGIWLVAVNIPIFIYCFVTFRKSFAVKTLLYVLLLAVLMLALRLLKVSTLVEKLMYGSTGVDSVIYVILGGALHGVSLPLILSVNGSTGGSDIVGIIVSKRSKSSSSVAMRFILLTNTFVVLVSSVVYGVIKKNAGDALNMFIYSVAAMFICEIVQEWMYKGFSAAVELEITTQKPVEMAEALQQELKHGVTSLKVVGGYSGEEKTMLLCVVNKQQLTHARRIINKVDEHAFAYVEHVKEVLGKGFANKENDIVEN